MPPAKRRPRQDLFRRVYAALVVFVWAIPLARSYGDEQSPRIEFVYYRSFHLPFAMDAPARKNIYSVTTENAEEKQLTTDGHSFNPVLSPDGTRIAYVHVTLDTCEHCLVPTKYEVNVMNSDGTDPHTLASVEGPVLLSWSPDGQTLVYAGTASALDELAPDRSDLETVMKAYGASYSLYQIDLDREASPHLLADNVMSVLFAEPRWSPDGKWLAYNCQKPHSGKRSDLSLCLLKPEDAAKPQLSVGGHVFYSWSPDSTEIAFSALGPDSSKHRKVGYNIYVVRTDGSGPRLVTTSNDAHPPQWSPDGKTLIFCEREKDKSLIAKINADGTSLVRLTEPKLNASSPVWSGDSKQIVFTAPIRDKLQVHLMNADGSQVRALTHDRKLSCTNIRWVQNTRLSLLLCGRTVAPWGGQFGSFVDGEFYLLSVDDSINIPHRLATKGAIGISFAPYNKPKPNLP